MLRFSSFDRAPLLESGVEIGPSSSDEEQMLLIRWPWLFGKTTEKKKLMQLLTVGNILLYSSSNTSLVFGYCYLPKSKRNRKSIDA